jgi:hypothetical protein
MASQTFAALSVRNFRLYFAGQLVSVSGTWMQSIAQGWLVLQITNNSTYLGISIALQYVPMLLLGSYGGLVADRFDKRRILYCTQSSAGLLALMLGLVTATNHANLTVLFAISLALGVSNLFDVPARQAFVQEMVGRDLIANAVSLNSVLMNAGRLIGPAIAAGTIALVGVASCFFINAASYVAVIAALAMMRASEITRIKTVRRGRGQLRLGLRYAWSEPTIRNVVASVAVVGTFAFNFTVTLPVLARHTFHHQIGQLLRTTHGRDGTRRHPRWPLHRTPFAANGRPARDAGRSLWCLYDLGGPLAESHRRGSVARPDWRLFDRLCLNRERHVATHQYRGDAWSRDEPSRNGLSRNDTDRRANRRRHCGGHDAASGAPRRFATDVGDRTFARQHNAPEAGTSGAYRACSTN